MEKVRIVIVEDEFVIAEDISARLTEHGYEVQGVFDRGEEALAVLASSPADIILVDIRLSGKMDGVTLVEEIQKLRTLPVIYITANSDSATYERARKTKPHAFLVKPFTPINLLSAIDLALFNFQEGKSPESIQRPAFSAAAEIGILINQAIFVRTNGKYRKLCPNDLLFVEASGSYVHLHTRTERFTLAQNLASFQRRTPLPSLVRVHRSYMVNVDMVESFEESFVFVQKHKLPISDNYKNGFLARVHCL